MSAPSEGNAQRRDIAQSLASNTGSHVSFVRDRQLWVGETGGEAAPITPREGGAIAVQSTSPFFARDAFLVIGATIRAGGFSALPYHAHVPSFGQWGFHLGWRDPRTAKDVKATLRRAETLPSSVRYLTAETIEASFVFGKDRLISPNPIQPSTRLAPTVLEAYRRGWEGSE